MSKILNLIRPVLGTDGNVTYTSLCKFPINSGAKKKFTLGKEDYIKVSFSTHDELSLNIGDGIDDDDIGVYKLKKRYKPTYDENTYSYKYDLQLDSYYMLWANILMVYNPSVAAGELSFGLTGRLELHSELLKSNLKANGFKYRGLDFVVVIDSANVKNEAKLVECDGTDIISYLNTLCDKDHFNCEWWVVQNKIYFGKCEFDNDNATENGYLNNVKFEIGKNCSSMKANETQDEFANRIYVFGGTNNITGRYRKKLIYKVSDVVDYNSTQKIIKDSSRPLFAYYFKSQEKANKSYSVTNSVGYNVIHNGVQSNDFHVKFDFNSFPCGGLIDFSGIKCGIQLFDANNNVVAPSSTFNYTLDIYVVGQKNSVPVTINHITQTGAVVDLSALSDTISISDEDCKGFAFPYISFNFSTDIDASTYTNIKRAVWNFSGNAVFSLSSPVINTKLSYNGSLYDVVINHDNSSSTDMNILLPAGLSIPVLGEYTLPNIITGKVPSSQFTAAEGETNNDLVYQGTIQKRLMLPVGTPYIQTDKNLTPEQIKIAILTYDDIYPRFNGQKITSVSSVDHEEKDGNGDITAKYPIYTVGDKNLVFDKNCILENTTPMIIFQTGLLAGNSLSLTYLGTTNGEAQFRIEHDDKLDLPNSMVKPTVGDEYVLYNIDTSYYFSDGAGTLEDKAEQELLEQGEKDAKDILNLEDTFDCSMISDIMKKGNISYQVGQKVTLLNNNYFAAGTRDSRVIGYEICLDKPYDKPVYSIGNSVKYSLVADLENKIEKLKFNGGTYYGVAGGSNSSSYSIYVVNKSDTTKLSDVNVMSSLRAIQELDDRALSKQHDDRTEYNLGVGKDLTVDGKATISELITKALSVASATIADLTATTLKATSATIVGALTAATVSATTMSATTFNGELNGNAATASKLKTARTIWGQTFDGSGNISGALTSAIIHSTTIDATTFIGDLRGNAATASKWKTPVSVWGQSIDGSGGVDGSLTIHANGSQYYKFIRNSNGADEYSGLLIHASDDTRRAWVLYNGNIREGYLEIGTDFSDIVINPKYSVGINTTSPICKLDVNGNMRVVSDLYADASVGTRNFASHTSGWRVNSQGAADFRNIYADELRVQAFTADISQALAGSDYLTKSVSKLSANFVVPSAGGSVRIIVDDIEGMPATQCFSNGDYVRFRAFNRTSGLTIANVWGTVSLDTSFGTNGFSNGTQAYTFTCTATTGAGLTVFKGSEVLDYGTSGSGMISRTTLDAMGSPYEQIATWVNDPSNSANYTVHARLGNLNGIANCTGYGLYTDNGYFTGNIVIGDLTKSNNFLSFDAVNGLQIKLGGANVATSTDVSGAINAAALDATTKANNAYSTAKSYTDTQITATNGSITAAVKGIQVGGRNLARSSKGDITFYPTDIYNFAHTICYAYWVGNKSSNIMISGDVEYSDIVFTGTGTPLFNINGPQDVDQWTYAMVRSCISNIHSGSGSFHFSVYWNNSKVFNNNYLIMQMRTDYITGRITFRNIKIEYGTKETSWTPAPEDVDASISTAQSTAISQSASNAAALYVTSSAYNAEVTILQNSITSKVSQTDYNANNTAINSHFTTIEQTATGISTRVDTAQATANTANTNLGAFKTTVASTYSTIAQTANNITASVNAIQVGGRNLAISGGYNTKLVTVIGEGDGTNETVYQTDIHAYLKAGVSYIFSCNTDGVWGSGINDSVEAYLLLDNTYNTYYHMDNNVFSFTPSVTGNYYLRLDVNQNNKTHWFSEIQIEEGNKETTYTPAPEDVDASIASAQSTAISQSASNAAALYVTSSAYNAEVTILQNSINSKVSQTDFNALGQTVGQHSTAIQQNAQAITSKVSSTDYTGANIASLINQSASTVTINAQHINLAGAVTITDFDSTVTASALGGATPKDVSSAQTAAQTYATTNCVKTDASNAPNSIKNSNISIASDGTLSNAGGGKVTISGLGYTGALDATKGAPTGTYVGSTLAQTVESNAANALSNAATAQGAANTANKAIANIVSDNILSAAEKPNERSRWNDISNEKSGIVSQANTYGITTELTNYNNAYQALATYLNNGTTWTSGIPTWLADASLSVDTAVVGSTYRTNWNNYFNTRQILLNAIYAKAKTLADAAQCTANIKVQTYFATSAPTTTTIGDLWYNTSTSLLKRWDGASWVIVSNAYTNTNQLTDGANLGRTAAWSGIANIPSMLGTPSSAGLYLTATSMGYWNGTAFKTYMDNAGNMVMGDIAGGGNGVSWNQATAAMVIRGEVYVTGGNALTSSYAKFTHIDGNGVYTGTLTADQVNAVAINASSISVGTLSVDRLGAHVITSDKVNMTEFTASTGFVDAFNANVVNTGRLNAAAILTNALTSNTITATNATIANLTMTNASVSGTLVGVSGTFNYLQGVGSKGKLLIDRTYGSMTIEDEDFRQQGTKDGRTLRYYSANIRCRGAFGAVRLNMAIVHDTTIYYYVNGDTSSYVAMTLQPNGVGGYYIPLFPTSDTGYINSVGNATLVDVSGFPVDLLIFDNSSNYQYEMQAGSCGKKITVMNAHDGPSIVVYLAINGDLKRELNGGKVQTFINIRELTNPLISSSVHGAGWMLCGEFDNNWT